MARDKSWSGGDRNLLTPKQVQHAKAGRHRDGGGLFLDVDDQGRRWVFRKQAGGKRHEFGLGSAIDVPLAEARKQADEYRTKLRNGVDPAARKKERREQLRRDSIPTFGAAAVTVYEVRQAAWKSGKHQAQWISSLRQFAFPLIEHKPVDQVDSDDVLKILSPIWHTKRETARRVRQRIGAVLDWAKVSKYRTGDNPIELIAEALGRSKMGGKHHLALPFGTVAKFLDDLRAG